MEQNVITPEEMQALVKAQQGELDAVLMYKALAEPGSVAFQVTRMLYSFCAWR